MSKIYQDIMQGMQEILEFEQGKRKLRVDNIYVVPLEVYSADTIKQIRSMLDMSQRVFASVIGVSAKTVEAWESGKNKPSGSSARMLQLIKEKPELTHRFYRRSARTHQ